MVAGLDPYAYAFTRCKHLGDKPVDSVDSGETGAGGISLNLL